MKLPVIENVVESIVSRPARGAWIEIAIWSAQAGLSVSRPARGAWIEI